MEESVYEKDDTTTIFLPDFDQDTVGNMINLLLHGMVNCPDLVSLAKLQKLTRTMKLIFNFLLPGEPPPDCGVAMHGTIVCQLTDFFG